MKSAPASLTDLWVSAIRVAGGKFATLSVQSTKTQLQRKYDIGFAIKQGGWREDTTTATAIARFSQGRRSS